MLEIERSPTKHILERPSQQKKSRGCVHPDVNHEKDVED